MKKVLCKNCGYPTGIFKHSEPQPKKPKVIHKAEMLGGKARIVCGAKLILIESLRNIPGNAVLINATGGDNYTCIRCRRILAPQALKAKERRELNEIF